MDARSLSLLGSIAAILSCAGSDPPAVDAGGASTGTSVTSAGCMLQPCPVVDDGQEGPPVSFRQDLLPAIQRNCSDVPCHGKETGGAAGLFLAPPPPAAADASGVLGRLVGVPSRTASGLRLIAPGDPSQSFLVIKVEGCQNALGLTCTAQPGAVTAGPCGDTMPQGARPLCNAERVFLRHWIRQGASDN